VTQIRPSRPTGDLIDRVHRRWWGDYKKLEAHHGYIQWLFPLFEGGGMNYQSSRLTKGEGAHLVTATQTRPYTKAVRLTSLDVRAQPS
jgi:hypothetical protein